METSDGGSQVEDIDQLLLSRDNNSKEFGSISEKTGILKRAVSVDCRRWKLNGREEELEKNS